MIFYVLNIGDNRGQVLLDAVKFSLRFEAKSASHLTLRGPYKRPLKKEFVLSRRLVPSVELNGVGCFFNASQNTVFIEVKRTKEIDALWKKKDFPDGTAHITLYDGKDRSVAEAIYREANQLRLVGSIIANSRMHRLERPSEFAKIISVSKALEMVSVSPSFMDKHRNLDARRVATWDLHVRLDVAVELLKEFSVWLRHEA